MEQGWVYVMVNPSMPGCIKVGRTTRPPEERAAELSQATGVATPFLVVFEQLFADCALAERDIHHALQARGERVAANREFFRTPPSDAIRIILRTPGALDALPGTPPGAGATELVDEGDRFLHGSGEAMQDLTEALRCYRLAARRGSAIACERLGMLHAELERTPAGRKRALRWLKEGVRRGNYYCYRVMADLFALDLHLENTRKAWQLFFARRELDEDSEIERFLEAGCRYIAHCVSLGLQPDHVGALKPHAEALTQRIVASLDRVRDAPEERLLLAQMVRWANAYLMPPARSSIPPSRGFLARWRSMPVRLGEAPA